MKKREVKCNGVHLVHVASQWLAPEISQCDQMYTSHKQVWVTLKFITFYVCLFECLFILGSDTW